MRQQFWYLLLVLLEISVFTSNQRLLAQVSNPTRPQEQPNPFLRQPKMPEIPSPQLSPNIPLQLPFPIVPLPDERLNIPGSITVSRFEFVGNTAFSNEELTQITSSFLNRSLTFAELLQAEAAVTKHYTDAGYINSGAVIPAGQTFFKKGAVVKIQVIEGGIEEIRITVDAILFGLVLFRVN